MTIPWFGWLFRWPVRGVLARKYPYRSWWAPPDRLDQTQVLVLGLLAAASMSAAFVNTLFTQTVNFAADDFGVDNTGIGIAGAVVRVGIVIALPAAILADRIGRRRVIVAVAWLAPLLSVLGAIAPTFGVLVVTQTLARPMGVALAFLVGVVAAEEVPKNSRAYAVSILAMAAGFGAGVAVLALRLADVGPSGWRLVYVVSLVWCVVALDLARRLPETAGSSPPTSPPHSHRPPLNRRRLLLLSAVAFIGNIFIAPASFFQNRYLTDVQGFSGGMIGLFSIAVGTPAGIGLIVGGRIADTSGRRRLIAVALPVSTVAIVGAFMVSGVVAVDPVAGRWPRGERGVPGPRRLSRGAVPDRQPQPGRRAGDRGLAHRRGARAAGDGCAARRELDVRIDPGDPRDRPVHRHGAGRRLLPRDRPPGARGA